MSPRVLFVQLKTGYNTDTRCGLATTVIDEDLREAYEAFLSSAPCGGHKNWGIGGTTNGRQPVNWIRNHWRHDG